MLLLLLYCLFRIEGADAECYAGADPPLCSTCEGVCETNKGCMCKNTVPCVPGSYECKMADDTCCPTGFYWNSSLSCCTDSPPCYPPCAGDEVCDTTKSGGPTCVCIKQIYENRTISDLVPSVTCYADRMIASISQCLLNITGYNYSNVYVDNVSENCTKIYTTITNNIRMLNIEIIPKLGWCAKVVTRDSSKIYYSNNIYIAPKHSVIITRNTLKLNISCGYNLTDQTTLNIPVNVTKCSKAKLQDYTPKTGETESSTFQSTTMSAYLDPQYTTPLGSNTVSVGTDLYLSLISHYVDEELFILSVQNCFATSDDNITNTNRVQLVSGGCPANEGVYVKMIQNGLSSEARFQIKAFAFADFPLAYITCKVYYCSKYSACPMCNEYSLVTQDAPVIVSDKQGTTCYNGTDYIRCDSVLCSGSCALEIGCFCADGDTLCIPATECILISNQCCPSGLFWDIENICCTETPLCSPPCHDDEVCAYASNVTTCVCNSTYYADKTVADLAPLLVCDPGVMVISVSKCLLESLGYDYTTMHINNNSNICTIYYSDVSSGKQVYSFQIEAMEGWCGNIVTRNSSMIYYTNRLYIDIQKGNVINANPISFEFTCAYWLKWEQSLKMNIKRLSSAKTVSSSSCEIIQEESILLNLDNQWSSNLGIPLSNGTDLALNTDLCTNSSCCTINLPSSTEYSPYSIYMGAYIDGDFTIPLTEISIGSYVYVGMAASADGKAFSLSVEQCIVSPINNRNDSDSVILISGGCAVDTQNVVEIITSGQSMEVRLKILAFSLKQYENYYMFFDMKLCDKTKDCTKCNTTSTSSASNEQALVNATSTVSECYAEMWTEAAPYYSCEVCGGICSNDTGCICEDGVYQCLPTDCLMRNNACCPEGLFWDPIKSCCTRTLWCNPSCGQDEICTNITNSATCVCNNGFYKNSTTADITPFITCGFGIIEVYVASLCLLDYLGYDYRNLLLGDSACTFSYISYYNNKPVVIFKLNAESGWCGNKLTMDSSSFHYTNTLHIGIKNETLITVNPIFFDFTCSYNLTQNTSLSSSIRFSSCPSNTTNTTQSIINSTTTATLTTTATTVQITQMADICTNTTCCKNNVTGSLDVMMMAFMDNSFTQPITTDSTLYVGTDIYLAAIAPYLEASVFSLKVLRCFAAPTNNRSDSNSIEFVTNGCPTSNAKNLANIISNGNPTEALFKFRLFQFQGYEDLFIFCDVTVCTRDCSLNCTEELSASLSGADSKCYDGSIVACETCGGSCDTGPCFCVNAIDPCVPTTADVCVSQSNECCPHGYYYDTTAVCCTDTVTCNPLCAEDEYCALGICVCNLAMYKDKTIADLNISVVCDPGVMEVSISRCLLTALGYNYNEISLTNNSISCTLTFTSYTNNRRVQTIKLYPEDGWCGTVMTMDMDYLYYTNIIHIGIQDESIITAYPATFQATCAYRRREQLALNMTLHPVIGTMILPSCLFPLQDFMSVQEIILLSSINQSVYNLPFPGDVNQPIIYDDVCAHTCCLFHPPTIATGYNKIIMAAYLDDMFTIPVTEDIVLLVGSDIYLAVFATNMDANGNALRVEQCFASPSFDLVEPSVVLIYGGCAVNSGVHTEIIENGVSSEARFRIQVFKFQSFDGFNIFCETTICNKSEDCTQCSASYATTAEVHIQNTMGTCYNGPIVACDTCAGSCDTGPCFCIDGIESCVPTTADVCLSESNDCCPTDYYYNRSAICCTDTAICNPPCADDEYCTAGTCACNITMYKNKTISNLLKVNCNEDVITLSLSKCLLEYLGYDYSSIHLIGDSSECDVFYTSIENGQQLVHLQSALVAGWCGNTVTVDSSKAYYTNTLFITPLSTILITVIPVQLNFTCAYNLTTNANLQNPLNMVTCNNFEGNISQAINITDNNVYSTTMGPPDTTSTSTADPIFQNMRICNDSNCCFSGSRTVNMAAYWDTELTMPVQESDVLLPGSDIYLGIYTSTWFGDGMVQTATQCFAAPVNDRNYPNKVQLLSDGCPTYGGNSIVVIQNGDSLETRIKMSAFQFQGYAQVFIFCDVQFCFGSCNLTCNNDGPSSNDLQLSSVTGLGTSVTTCLRDELCVLTSGIASCACNTTAPTDTSLENAIVGVTCEPKSMKVALRECLLVQLGYNPSSVRLTSNDSWCSAVYSHVVNDTRIYTIEAEPSTGCCGNEVMVNASHVTYLNALHIEPLSPSSIEWTVNISCAYTLSWESQRLLSVSQENWTLTVNEIYTCNDLLCAKIYVDDQFSQPLFIGQSFDVNSTLFIMITTSLQDSNRFHIVVDQFSVSSLNDSSSSSETLMQNGLTYYPGLQLLNNWTGNEARFSVQTTFFTNRSSASLFYTARLCDSYNEQCCKFLFKLL
ncbi:uncharacterized protein LOC143815762 isoform X2 [Ranitomeya variabilis]|uniref:uncharacterized protein LOC143815762 isoform X2 n=1 Tax=Ranitomeya variabilis TaxID=490064 RepID=UPI004056CCBD